MYFYHISISEALSSLIFQLLIYKYVEYLLLPNSPWPIVSFHTNYFFFFNTDLGWKLSWAQKYLGYSLRSLTVLTEVSSYAAVHYTSTMNMPEKYQLWRYLPEQAQEFKSICHVGQCKYVDSSLNPQPTDLSCFPLPVSLLLKIQLSAQLLYIVVYLYNYICRLKSIFD